MSEPILEPRAKSRDIRCLKCGAFNIPDNHICGRCGANLPLVYDEHGQVFHWEEAKGFKAVMKIPAARSKGPSIGKTRWLLRGVVLLIAVLFALYLLTRRS